jgi:hypothetical protein
MGTPYVQPAEPNGRQPLGAGGVVRTAFELYAKQAVNLWTIVTLIVVPSQVIVWVITRLSLNGGTTFALNGTVYTSNSTAPAEIAIIVFGFLSGVLCIGALSRCLLDTYTGHPTGWRESLSFAAERLGPLIWLALLTGVLLAIGFILFIIPGIYLTVAWIVAVPVLMFEGHGGWGALSRSRELTSGHWWSTFGALLLGLICIIGASIIVGAILSAIANSSSVNVILILSGVSRILSSIITYPILAAISAVLYADLRGRKEHIDTHHMTGVDTPEGAPETPDHFPDIGLS